MGIGGLIEKWQSGSKDESDERRAGPLSRVARRIVAKEEARKLARSNSTSSVPQTNQGTVSDGTAKHTDSLPITPASPGASSDGSPHNTIHFKNSQGEPSALSRVTRKPSAASGVEPPSHAAGTTPRSDNRPSTPSGAIQASQPNQQKKISGAAPAAKKFQSNKKPAAPSTAGQQHVKAAAPRAVRTSPQLVNISTSSHAGAQTSQESTTRPSGTVPSEALITSQLDKTTAAPVAISQGPRRQRSSHGSAGSPVAIKKSNRSGKKSATSSPGTEASTPEQTKHDQATASAAVQTMTGPCQPVHQNSRREQTEPIDAQPKVMKVQSSATSSARSSSHEAAGQLNTESSVSSRTALEIEKKPVVGTSSGEETELITTGGDVSLEAGSQLRKKHTTQRAVAQGSPSKQAKPTDTASQTSIAQPSPLEQINPTSATSTVAAETASQFTMKTAGPHPPSPVSLGEHNKIDNAITPLLDKPLIQPERSATQSSVQKQIDDVNVAKKPVLLEPTVVALDHFVGDKSLSQPLSAGAGADYAPASLQECQNDVVNRICRSEAALPAAEQVKTAPHVVEATRESRDESSELTRPVTSDPPVSIVGRSDSITIPSRFNSVDLPHRTNTARQVNESKTPSLGTDASQLRVVSPSLPYDVQSATQVDDDTVSAIPVDSNSTFVTRVRDTLISAPADEETAVEDQKTAVVVSLTPDAVPSRTIVTESAYLAVEATVAEPKNSTCVNLGNHAVHTLDKTESENDDNTTPLVEKISLEGESRSEVLRVSEEVDAPVCNLQKNAPSDMGTTEMSDNLPSCMDAGSPVDHHEMSIPCVAETLSRARDKSTDQRRVLAEHLSSSENVPVFTGQVQAIRRIFSGLDPRKNYSGDEHLLGTAPMITDESAAGPLVSVNSHSCGSKPAEERGPVDESENIGDALLSMEEDVEHLSRAGSDASTSSIPDVASETPPEAVLEERSDLSRDIRRNVDRLLERLRPPGAAPVSVAKTSDDIWIGPENSDKQDILVDVTEAASTVHIYGCRRSRVCISGRVTGVVIENSSHMVVEVENTITAQLKLTHSAGVQVALFQDCPPDFEITSCDDITCFLPFGATCTQITSALSSRVTICHRGREIVVPSKLYTHFSSHADKFLAAPLQAQQADAVVT